MKRAAKAWMIVAAVLIGIGAILFVSVMAANHWDFSAIANVHYETRTVAVDDAFTGISVRSDTADVMLVPSSDGKCRVELYENEKVRHTVSVNDGVLTVGENDTRKWFERIAFSFGSPKITVYLPETAYETLLIRERTGDVQIPADFIFDSIDITANTGDVSCFASCSGSIAIRTDTGDIRIENGSAESLTLSVTTGEAGVRSFTCEKGIDLTVTTGDAYLSDVTCESLTSTGDTGDITLRNVIVSERISIERDTGDVRFEKCDAGEIDIETDTGDVTGSLLSDKVFITKSDIGDVNVPETTSGGTCRITTDTGDIRITVE